MRGPTKKTDIIEYLDQLTFDYTQLCQRDDGTIYGIASGKLCRRGKPIAYNPNDERHRRIAFNQKLKKPRAIARLLIGKFKKLGGNKSTVREAKNQTVEDIKSGKAKGEGIFKTFGRKLDNLKGKLSSKATKKPEKSVSTEAEKRAKFDLSGFTRVKTIDEKAKKLISEKDSQKIKDKLNKAVREGKINPREALDTYDRTISRLEKNLKSIRDHYDKLKRKEEAELERKRLEENIPKKARDYMAKLEKIDSDRKEALKNTPTYEQTPGSRKPIPSTSTEELREIGKKVLAEYPELENDDIFMGFMNGGKYPPLSVIYEMQGFNSKPELVGSKSELMKRTDLVKGHDGSSLLFHRGAGIDYTQQLLGTGVNGEFHGPGRGTYGHGSYAAASVRDPNGNPGKAKRVAEGFASMGRKGEEDFGISKQAVTFGLREDSRYKYFNDSESFRNWVREVSEEAERVTGLKSLDIGVAAAVMGIHAYNVPNPEYDGVDFWVILNRGALVISTEDFD
jgi:hypothetical protein